MVLWENSATYEYVYRNNCAMALRVRAIAKKLDVSWVTHAKKEISEIGKFLREESS